MTLGVPASENDSSCSSYAYVCKYMIIFGFKQIFQSFFFDRPALQLQEKSLKAHFLKKMTLKRCWRTI